MRTTLGFGQLKQKMPDGNIRVKDYTLGLIDEAYLSAMMALQEVIVEHLSHPTLLQTFSREFMKQHLGMQGMVLGVLVENRLVAFRNVYFPAPWDVEWNLGIDLGLPATELHNVANLQMVCVHPQFRGNALGHKLNRISLDLLGVLNSHHHVCATVSPDNIWNIPILLKSGFHIVKLKEKYGGKTRYVVYQNLRNPIQFDHTRMVYVRSDDLSTQKRLLACGLVGVTQHLTRRRSGGNATRQFHLVFKSPRCEQTDTETFREPLRRTRF